MLKSIGIDVDRQLELLARRSIDNDNEGDPFDYSNETFDLEASPELTPALEGLIEDAIKNGFPPQHKSLLHEAVFRYDIWRIELKDDPLLRYRH